MIERIQKLLLDIVGYQLFGGERLQADSSDAPAVLKEARQQAVFTTVFPFLKNELKSESPVDFFENQEFFLGNVMKNTGNFLEHGELHRLMEDSGIPYCTLKGIASAYHYPESSLREMGDVDFLVYPADFERAKNAVLSAGFHIDHGEDEDALHLAFKREPLSIWEQHRSVNGIPSGEAGERIREELESTIETSVLIELDGAVCRIPDDFHHGLIMLLHVISHMTSEGIGLRHLCDWAVFVNRMESERFTELFEEKLKSFGLWKFCCILTLVSERYLGAAHKKWAENSEITDELLEELITDILNGGNFGKKDMNRYREIKYISNRGENTVDSKHVALQVVDSMNKKVYASNYRFIGKRKALLPIGWAVEGGKYLGLLVTGKRKNKGTSAMLREAAKRKSIYSRMDLFGIEDCSGSGDK